MTSRRDFLKHAALLAGVAGFSTAVSASVQKAVIIDPEVGSTYLDAEHVVILMQENRSFDHCFGSLQGVRGFNDPRSIELPNKNRVWLQTNASGETYAPFNLNLRETSATWMGSLPHSWTDQTDARNGGKHDRWLETKKSGHAEYQHMPLTLGFYNREDIPFYYSLADAFTICDQNFCSSLTGTTANRLYLWTGTIRDEQHRNSPARVRNSDLDYDVPAEWKTFPERLEDNNVSWKIYQNELSVGVGLGSEEDSWLANYTDNPIEWFTQYQVKFLPAYIRFLPKRIELMKAEIHSLETMPQKDPVKATKRLAQLKVELPATIEDLKSYTAENYAKLPPRQKNLHQKAFTTNTGDRDYHQLTTMKYKDGGVEREVQVPKGDVLYQFREDVKAGKLPPVSWLVAPEYFSDHAGSPWYGAWYVSEVLDILTQNPAIWKKTIFILCYDENDGYFDHIPPFTPPHPDKPNTGLTSKGIDSGIEFVTMAQDLKRQPAEHAREGPIGLGYRVPLIVASPWSRGGFVNSQVFDHTSILQFLEKFLSHRTGRRIRETNISTWRRTVCGDLTSVFRPYESETAPMPESLYKDAFIEAVHNAKFRKVVSGYRALSKEEVEQINTDPLSSSLMPKQETGLRPSCALPYELYVDGKLSDDKKWFRLRLAAKDEIFGDRAAGAPFLVYAGPNQNLRSYAVTVGDTLTDSLRLRDFADGTYALRVHGPNGFFREFNGDTNDPAISVDAFYERSGDRLTGNLSLRFMNSSNQPQILEIRDNAYKSPNQRRILEGRGGTTIIVDLSRSLGWYDVTVTVAGAKPFLKRYAGRIETGRHGFTDPAMG